MKLTKDLILELRRLSEAQNEPVLSEAAERLELCDKSHSTMLRLLSNTKEDLEAVKSERDRMLEDMRGVCRVCVNHDSSCAAISLGYGGACENWKWRGDK